MLQWPRDAIIILVGAFLLPLLAAIGMGIGLQLTGVV